MSDLKEQKRNRERYEDKRELKKEQREEEMSKETNGQEREKWKMADIIEGQDGMGSK